MKRSDRLILDELHRLSEPEPEPTICPECGAFMEPVELLEWVCPECGKTYIADDE